MKRITSIILFLTLSFFLNTNYLYAKNSNKLYEKIDLFGEVLETIKQEYVDEVDQADIMDSAINGLLQSLDPYSAYMSPKSFEGMRTDTKGEFGGLGIEIGMESGVVKVISPIDDTPAANAGIKAGDYIVRINGKQVQGKTLTDAVELMRGPVGSEIKLTIRRKNVKKALEFKIKRAVKNGGGLRLTISKYYLPSGKSISEVGVLPDIFVEETGANFKINTDTDNQLRYAVELFKS